MFDSILNKKYTSSAMAAFVCLCKKTPKTISPHQQIGQIALERFIDFSVRPRSSANRSAHAALPGTTQPEVRAMPRSY